MPNEIRVLIADDEIIAREGIQRILESAPEIKLIGVAATTPDVLLQVRQKQPDVLLLDLRWYGDEIAMPSIIGQIRQEYPDLCIIGLTAYEHLMPRAVEAGANWVSSKYIGKDELIGLVRSAAGHMHGVAGASELEQAEAALRRIVLRKAGAQNTEHERDVATVLQTIFHPHLTNLRQQPSTLSGTYRRDILLSNYSTNPFWQKMVQLHDASQIVFEVKNVKIVHVSYVLQLASYLTPGLGRIGFLVIRRSPAKEVVRRAVQVFHDQNKVVLFLCDDDLTQIFGLKLRGEDPTPLIAKLYDAFVDLT